MNFANQIEVKEDRFKEVKTVHQITAFCFEDETNTKYHKLFDKDVEIFIRDGRTIISFGGPIEYNLADLIDPDKGKFPQGPYVCIDAYGRNHGVDGKSVYVSRIAWDHLIEIAYENSYEKHTTK